MLLVTSGILKDRPKSNFRLPKQITIYLASPINILFKVKDKGSSTDPLRKGRGKKGSSTLTFYMICKMLNFEAAKMDHNIFQMASPIYILFKVKDKGSSAICCLVI